MPNPRRTPDQPYDGPATATSPRLVSVAAALVGLLAGFTFAEPAAYASGGRATVRTPGIPLNVRSGPATHYRLTERVPNGRQVSVTCTTHGQPIRGAVSTTDVWAHLSGGGYASAAYLAGLGRTPACGTRHRESGAARVSTPGIPLNVRSGPATRYRLTERIPNGRPVSITCTTRGQTIHGTVTTTATWARLSRGGYASAAYLRGVKGVGSCRGSGRAPGHAEFLRRAAAAARHTDRRYGVPASVTIAQAMLESGWGASGLATEGNNYFGMKCFGVGRIAVGCRSYRTFECLRDGHGNRRCHRTHASFRMYDSVTDSFEDHARLLALTDRYRTAMRHRDNPNRFAIEVHRAGYATGPGYSRKLIALMRAYHLYRFN